MESFGRIIAILTAVVLICFYPLQSISAQQILIQDNYIQNETIKFVDQALQSGQITQEAYDRYLERIQLTEEPYSVRFTIAHLLDVYEEDLPVSRSSYSTFSLTENTYSTYSSRATHVHTDNCYAGHRHTDTCYDSHVHDSSCYEYEYATCYELYGGVNAYDSSGMDQITCNTCGAIGTMQVWKYYTSCTECGLGMMVHQYCESASCTNCGDGWYWDDGTLDSPCDREYLKSETLICSESEEPYLICPEAEDNTPICNRVVLTLTPTNSVQEVALGVTIDTTAIATFLDGSSSIVTCTSNYDSTILGVQTVTLTYGEFVDTAKNKVSKTATITVTVTEKITNITCPNGHTYPANTDGTDPGCPECVATLVPTLSATTVYSGAELPLTSLLVTYQDGHTETVTSGWTHNFDTTQCGTQAVTIQYKNGSCTTDIIVKPNPVGLSVTATPNEVLNGEEPIYTVTVLYEDGTSKVVTTGYTKTGFTAGAGTKQVIFSYTENGITVTDTVEVIVKVKSHTCPVCGNTYDIDVEDTGCPVCKVTLQAIEAAPNKLTVRPGEVLTLTVTAIYQDGHTEDVTGWTHDYDNTKIGTQTVTVTYKNKTTTVEVVTQTTLQCDKCGATYEPAADGRDPGCPICQSVVIGITVSPFSQTVSYGAEISLTVRATYRDGHTEIVADWSSNYDPYLVGPQTITVFYQAMTAEATVTVLSNQMVVCPLCGQSYDAGLYPYGCPICAAMPVDLKAYLGTGGNQVTYGSQLGLDVILIYRDGHAEQVTEGWRVQNYNPYQLGMQQVQIAYQGLTTTLMIDVVTTLHSTTCPNGHTYYLEQDGSDPGCPYCAIPELDDTRYYDLTFTNEVTEHIFVDGYYFLEAGDLLSVEVSPRVESFWMQLQFIFTAADEHR